MKPEEIKIGGVYDVRVKVMKKIPAPARGDFEIGAYTVDRTTQLPMEYEMSWFLTEEAAAFVEITTENGIKNSEPATKYDPCRLYRKGDKVRIKTANGRDFNSFAEEHKGKILTVLKDEEKYCNIFVETPISDDCFINPAYLELVTPVEELEPYYVEQQGEKTGGFCFAVIKRKGYAETTFYFGPCRSRNEQQANQAAEAECARLNAEHRKEQSHD